MGEHSTYVCPVDVREVREAGTFDDFRDGLAQAILNLVIANEIGGVTRGVYVYGTSFARMSMLRSGWTNAFGGLIPLVIEDSSTPAQDVHMQLADILVQKAFPSNMPWNLYDSIKNELNAESVQTFDEYLQAVMTETFGNEIPEENLVPVPNPPVPSTINFKQDRVDNNPCTDGAGSSQDTSAECNTLRDRLDVLRKLNILIVQVDTTAMSFLLHYPDRKKDDQSNGPQVPLNYTLTPSGMVVDM